MSSKFATHPGLKIDATFTIGTETSNVINVAIQLTDRLNGNEVGERIALPFYLSDDANGDSIAASAPSSGMAIGTDGLMIEWTADKAGLLISESDGDIDIDIDTTTSGEADTWYLVLVMPDGKLSPSGAITFA